MAYMSCDANTIYIIMKYCSTIIVPETSISSGSNGSRVLYVHLLHHVYHPPFEALALLCTVAEDIF